MTGNFRGRLAALNDLSRTTDSTIVPRLKALLDLPKPPRQQSINWNAAEAERVFELHVIEALHALGDDTCLDRFIPLVRQQSRRLSDREDGRDHVADVMRFIGRTELVGALIDLAVDADPTAAENGVRALARLSLPFAPCGQDVSYLARFSKRVNLMAPTRATDCSALATVSKGAFELSPRMKQLVSEQSRDCALPRSDTTFEEVVSMDFTLFNHAYFVRDGHVVICTPGEAGRRWQAWWKTYGAELVYRPESRSFALGKAKK